MTSQQPVGPCATQAGDILIQQGDVGLAASQLFVVKEGKFEVRVHCSSWP